MFLKFEVIFNLERNIRLQTRKQFTLNRLYKLFRSFPLTLSMSDSPVLTFTIYNGIRTIETWN